MKVSSQDIEYEILAKRKKYVRSKKRIELRKDSQSYFAIKCVDNLKISQELADDNIICSQLYVTNDTFYPFSY